MDFSSIVVVDLNSIAILAILFIQASLSADKNLLPQKLLMQTILVTALLLFLDIFSRFDGHPDTFYPVINRIGNFLIFLLGPLLPSFWLLYTHSQVSGERTQFRRWTYLIIGVFSVNAVCLVITQFTGWIYTLGADNIYHRGPLFWLSVSLSILLAIAAFILIVINRKNIEPRYFKSLVLFPIPPFICAVLQAFLYGTSLVLNGSALSILIVYITIQNRRINTDFLTGAYNRKGLELYIRQKINASAGSRTFSAMLLDLDNFKSINDTYGHTTGDNVLVTSVSLMRACIRPDDFIARYGGDEFYIILNVSKTEDLEAVAERIRQNVAKYNGSGVVPFKLGVSMGYAVYDFSRHPTAEDFLRQIDALMYENKRAKKELHR